MCMEFSYNNYKIYIILVSICFYTAKSGKSFIGHLVEKMKNQN